jgi:hypothetical protein
MLPCVGMMSIDHVLRAACSGFICPWPARIRIVRQNHRIIWIDVAILHALGMFVADMFKSRCRLEAANLFLRYQLNIALRRAPIQARLHDSDRALLVWMTRIWAGLLDLVQVVKPETILRWHRSGFKAYWRWKSRKRAGRPKC